MALGDNISGSDGMVKYGATPTEIKITKWNIKKKTSGPVPVNDSGSGGNMTNLPAKLVGFDGSFEGFLKKGVAGPTFNSVVAGEFYVDDNIKYEGDIIIGEEDINVAVDGTDAVKVGFSFEGTGELTKTDPTT